jgi:hypothetical protein
VDAVQSDPTTPRVRAPARTAQRWEQEWVTRRKERRIQRRERREQESEEYRLREQQGLSPRRRRRTHHHRRRRKKRATGAGPLREVESATPVTKGRRGGSGAGTRGECGGTRRRAVRGAGARDACGGTCLQAVSGVGARTCRRGVSEYRGSAGERYGSNDGCRSCASRTLEEEEAGLLQFEVSSTFSVRP